MKAKEISKLLLLSLVLSSFFLNGQYSHNAATSKKAFTRFLIPERIDSTCISFGQKLNCLIKIDEMVTWEIKEKGSGNTIISGSGDALHNYVFNTAGSYVVSLDHHMAYEPNSCNHGSLPDMLEVTVTPIFAKFGFNNISFSSPIQSNVPTNGIEISVNIDVALQGISSYEYKMTTVRTSGTDTEIIATPVQEQVTLINGANQLTYVLSGSVSRPSYIVFDFVDPNGKIQDYTYTLLIN